MHQIITKLISVALMMGLGLSAFAAPQEKINLTLTRNASSGLQSQESLSKNLYRQESRQVPYTIQEPYQDTEVYYENVPYQERETYYERVPYTETEYYTDYEDYYEREYRCETRNRSERICTERETCHVVPGRGDDGGPRRECTRVPECHTVNRPEQVCDYHSVRKTRPVQKTRQVTKYRDELRERWVTKYRSEARSRVVTRYRDKQVCCKTETYNVFDRQFVVPVTVIFPKGSELFASEQESFTLSLEGTEQKPTVNLKNIKTIFGYTIKSQQQRAGGVEIELSMTPLYTSTQLGVQTIQKLTLAEAKNGSTISFEDTGLRARVFTEYAYQIVDKGTQEMIAEGQIQAQGTSVRHQLDVQLQDLREYQIHLRVVRQGLPLYESIDFVTSAVKKITPLKNETLHMRRDLIKTFEIRGRGTDARLFFLDQSPSDEGVQTIYRIEILLGGERAPVASTREIQRENMPMTTKDFFKLSLLDDLGISAKDLNDKVRVGQPVTVRLTTMRNHPRLSGGQPVTLNHQFVQIVY